MATMRLCLPMDQDRDRYRDSGRHGPSIISRVVAGLQAERKKILARALVVVWITRRMPNCSGDTSAIEPGSAHVRSSSVSLSFRPRTLILVMKIYFEKEFQGAHFMSHCFTNTQSAPIYHFICLLQRHPCSSLPSCHLGRPHRTLWPRLLVPLSAKVPLLGEYR